MVKAPKFIYCHAFSILLLMQSVLLITLSGCMSYTVHDWQMLGNAEEVFINTEQWHMLPQAQYVRVEEAKMEEAVSLLKDDSYIPLGEPLLEQLCINTSRSLGDELRPYLVRGVIYGGNPTYTIIRYDSLTGQLFVHHATYNGENLLMEYISRKAVPVALVVYLPQKPTAVYPTANLAGDMIFSGRNLKELDLR